MTKYSYTIFQLHCHVRNRPKIRRPLHDIDGKGTDLFRLLNNQLRGCEGVVDFDKYTERAHRVERFQASPSKRTISVEGKAGPYGLRGTSVDLDTGDERDFTERTANMNPLRSMFLIPREGYDGLLFCERAGSSHFKSPLLTSTLKPIASDFNVAIKVGAYVDAEAWSYFLEHGQINMITAIYRSTRREDLGSHRGAETDLKIVAGGAVATRIGRRLGGIIASVAQQDGPVAYNIDHIPDLRPGDLDHYQRERLELKVRDGAESRTIVLERSELPQFTYALGGRVNNRVLWQAWREHGIKILSDLDGNIVL